MQTNHTRHEKYDAEIQEKLISIVTKNERSNKGAIGLLMAIFLVISFLSGAFLVQTGAMELSFVNKSVRLTNDELGRLAGTVAFLMSLNYPDLNAREINNMVEIGVGKPRHEFSNPDRVSAVKLMLKAIPYQDLNRIRLGPIIHTSSFPPIAYDLSRRWTR